MCRLGLSTLTLWAFLAAVGLAHAELRVAAPVIELGEVRGGQRLVQVFELTNAGTTPVEIVEVRRGCGCLAPRLASAKLQPGAKTTLHVELRTLGQADGPHAWNAQVIYRHGEETKSLPLTLRGVVRNEIVVQPALLALHLDKNGRGEITLVDRRATPLRVVAAEARSPALKVGDIVRAGNTTKVLLNAEVEQLPPGRYEGMVYVFTDDKDYEELQIPVTVTKGKRAAVQTVPERPELRLAGGAPSGSVLIRLRSLTGQSVRVSEVKAVEPGTKCTWAAGPGDDATVRLQLTKASTVNIVELHVVLEGNEALTVPVSVIRD
jgi:hypothetical protein